MKFKLTEKTYKEEKYEANPLRWKGKKIKPIVRMWYHTRLMYWDVAYNFHYGRSFVWIVTVRSKGKLNRREARRFARKYMKEASYTDIKKLSDFNKKSILEKK